MKYMKYMFVGLVFSTILACTGVSAALTEYTILSIEVPGARGVATVAGSEKHDGGYQYAKTTETIDKWSQEIRAVSARVKADSNGRSSEFVHIPNGGEYKSLGNLDFDYYKLQIQENSPSVFGLYWFGKWKINQ